MKCARHSAEAVGICAYCGRALCAACAGDPAPPRLVCSAECAGGLARTEGAMQMILKKSVQSLRASALYCYLCGGLSAGAAVAAWYVAPSPFLVWFTAGCAVVLVASGVFYGRAAGKQVVKS